MIYSTGQTDDILDRGDKKWVHVGRTVRSAKDSCRSGVIFYITMYSGVRLSYWPISSAYNFLFNSMLKKWTRNIMWRRGDLDIFFTQCSKSKSREFRRVYTYVVQSREFSWWANWLTSCTLSTITVLNWSFWKSSGVVWIVSYCSSFTIVGNLNLTNLVKSG